MASAILVTSLGVLALTILTDTHLLGIAVAGVFAALIIVWHAWVFRWQTLLGLLFVVILFIPIRRYILPGALPFQLEPYRVVVALLVLFWFTSLLIDPRVRLRRSGLEAPLALFVLAALISDILNWPRIQADVAGTEVAKSLTFFASFILIFYMVCSVVRREHIATLLKVLVSGGAVIAILAVIESRTGYNPFNELDRVLPFLQRNFVTTLPPRGARLRAYGPAEHAIALSAALAVLAPLAIYLAQATKRRRWWLATAILVVGNLATVSRTGVVMLGTEVLIFLWLKPAQVKRLWPLIIPGLIAVHFALPGTLGTLKQSFFPAGGLVKDQRGYADSGRVGDLGPSFEELSQEPIFGRGFGSRIELGRFFGGKFYPANARILDDQWLGTLVETGVVGTFAWLWLFLRTIRRLGRSAKDDKEADGWLYGGLAASMAAFAVGMFFYDAFSFVQVTFVLYIMLGLATVVLAPRRQEVRATLPSLVPAR